MTSASYSQRQQWQLLRGRSLPQTVLRRDTVHTTKIGKEGSKGIGNYRMCWTGESRTRGSLMILPHGPDLESWRSPHQLRQCWDTAKTVLISAKSGARSVMPHSLEPARARRLTFPVKSVKEFHVDPDRLLLGKDVIYDDSEKECEIETLTRIFQHWILTIYTITYTINLRCIIHVVEINVDVNYAETTCVSEF